MLIPSFCIYSTSSILLPAPVVTKMCVSLPSARLTGLKSLIRPVKEFLVYLKCSEGFGIQALQVRMVLGDKHSDRVRANREAIDAFGMSEPYPSPRLGAHTSRGVEWVRNRSASV